MTKKNKSTMQIKNWLDVATRRISSEQRMDAGETAAVARQLETLLTQTFDIEYPSLRCRDFFPSDNSVPAGADSFTYIQYDSFGQAAIISSYGDDIPTVNVDCTSFARKVVGVAVGFVISLQDIRASQMAGTDLDTRLAMAARRAVEEKVDEIAAIGSSLNGFTGFINNATCVSKLVSVVTGNWGSATADQMIADAQALWAAIPTNTNQVHRPNTLLLAPSNYVHLQKPRNSASDVTVAQWLLKNLEGLTTIDQWWRLETADVAGTGQRAIAYEKNPLTGYLEVPMEFTMHPPQFKGLGYSVPCEARIGGAIMPYPLAFAYMDGV